MAIWNCEFCNAYVTDFEVHYCRNFGNQHRQSSATLPRSSFANLVQDVDSRLALPMNYEEWRSVMGQINSSGQQSVLPNIHLRTTCEETATAEIPSPYGNENQNQYNPEISDSVFPNMAQGQENQSESTPSPIADQLNPMPVAEPRLLPGFQQAFGQRNALTNQLAQLPNASFQMECSGTSSTDVMSSTFTSDFNEDFNASANLMSQHYEISTGIPTSVDLNAQYNPMDPIPPTDSTGPIHYSKCPKDFQPKYHIKPSDLSSSVRRPYACNYCDKTFAFPSHLTSHIRTHTGEKPYKCKVCNKGFTENSLLTKHMRIHTGKTLLKCTECSESFVFHSRLEEHFSSVHPGKKLYKCEQCGNGFTNRDALRTHIRTVHTDDKPHKCTECGKCFAFLSLLKRHMLIHNKA
ncbi:hypothetical protein CEXT_184991 [Caerostris extrusa]|uniref:C2H2-type domain-containing protein n=1 Tax=Caerostris extrusa TaxID=172846 RepID=A0AAV4S3C9_CAEEX|nr:hypothetical protein CEXT_184991 [Caerostris extrusa]